MITIERLVGVKGKKPVWQPYQKIASMTATELLTMLANQASNGKGAYRAKLAAGNVSAKYNLSGSVYFGMPLSVLRAYGTERGNAMRVELKPSGKRPVVQPIAKQPDDGKWHAPSW